ncbi:MAG: GntR family transcriptional regulator [Rhodobacteraceae bacterium]|nr:GntR family transcriptional regulator [Paracoccaceae bacterium]
MQAEKNDTHQLLPLDSFSGSLSTRVHLVLKDAILSLIYKPGDALRKTEICDTLGVSRSPVSEAVAKLAAEGLVEVVPQAGTFVSRFSMDDIREGAFLREALEMAAVEYVALNITDPQKVLLRRNLRLQQALAEDGDVEGFLQMDADMHNLIMSFTGFKRLAILADTTWTQVSRARHLHMPTPGRMQSSVDEHAAIVAAIIARDPETAKQAIRNHVRQLVKYIEPLETERPELFKPA